MVYWISMFEVTVNTFKEILECEKPVLLFFHSAWCTGCGPEMEVLHALEKEFAGVLFAIVVQDKEATMRYLPCRHMAMMMSITFLVVSLDYASMNTTWMH